MQLTDPWAKLAAAYHTIGDQQALDILLKQRPAAAVGIADLLIAAGRTAEAIPVLAEASARTPDATLLALKVAALQAWFGKDADYTATSQRMLGWARDATKPEDFERVAKLASLRPVADATQREAALAFARRSVELGQKHPYLSYFNMALGIAEYRSGHYPEAERALLAAKAMDGKFGDTVCLYRAMCLFQQGKPAEARAFFTVTESKMQPFPAADQNPLATQATHDDLILWLTCKEAKALLAEPGIPPK
jgi:tetratricopeptide (TPR) repeat protein